jgi:tripartite-type tricarboxylate transporter receptor subunit TctC
VDKLQKDIEGVLAEQDIKDKYVSFGYVPFNVTREQFGKYIQTESANFADVIAKTKAALD